MRNNPEKALQFFEKNKDVWMIFYDKIESGYSSIAASPEWIGPFRISVDKSYKKLLIIYGRSSKIDKSQDEFLKIFKQYN